MEEKGLLGNKLVFGCPKRFKKVVFKTCRGEHLLLEYNLSSPFYTKPLKPPFDLSELCERKARANICDRRRGTLESPIEGTSYV